MLLWGDLEFLRDLAISASNSSDFELLREAAACSPYKKRLTGMQIDSANDAFWLRKYDFARTMFKIVVLTT